MKQVIRGGLKDIMVDEVPDPAPLPHHVLVRPLYSLISSGTETVSIHRGSLFSEVAMKTGPIAAMAEVRAKFTEFAALGYSGAGVACGGEGTRHGETFLVGRNLAGRMPDGMSCQHACFATLGSLAMMVPVRHGAPARGPAKTV